MSVHLGPDRYGKAGIRLAVVARDGARHTFTQLDVEVALEGAFDAAHVAGDNTDVLPTDTMRGTCFALARDGIDTVAGYARRVAGRLLEASPAVEVVSMTVVGNPWERLVVDGMAHDHAFRPAPGGQGVTRLTQRRGQPAVLLGGVRGLRVLKTTGSAFSDYLIDEFTTLPPTRDRIMATTVEATWATIGDDDVAHDALLTAVPATVAGRFATHDESESVQHTLWAMGRAVLDAHPAVGWIRFRLPNEHHVLADLSPYGLDNPDEVFLVADRPFGVIEGTVVRDGVDAPALPPLA